MGFSDEEATAIARALVELDGCRATVAALKETLGAKDAHVKALEAALAGSEAALARWREAAESRSEANAADRGLQKSYESSIAAYQLEIARLRQERDSARRSRFLWALGGAVIAVALVLGANGRD